MMQSRRWPDAAIVGVLFASAMVVGFYAAERSGAQNAA
jgi:hypothetical protein